MKIENEDHWIGAFLKVCQKGSLEEMKHLCQKKYLDMGWANIHVNHEYGLSWACVNGHLDLIKYLLTSPELIEQGHTWADVHAENEDGFLSACMSSQWEVIRWLVMDYGIKKTSRIKEVIQQYPQAQDYFRAREELKDIQNTLEISNPYPPSIETHDSDQRAAKKAKKL